MIPTAAAIPKSGIARSRLGAEGCVPTIADTIPAAAAKLAITATEKKEQCDILRRTPPLSEGGLTLEHGLGRIDVQITGFRKTMMRVESAH